LREEASAASPERGVDASPVCWGELLGDKKQLLAFVAALEQPPERGWRVLEAILHVDFGLNLFLPAPTG
jgi:hypothetical protein